MSNPSIKFNRKKFVALTAVMFLEVAGVTAFYIHQASAVSAIQKQYNSKTAELDQARQMGGQLDVVTKKLQGDQSQLGHLEQGLSTKEYVPTLLDELQKLATATNNQILSLKPIPAPVVQAPVNTLQGGTNPPNTQAPAAGDPNAAPASEPDYDKYQVELSVQGPYRNVMDFLMKLTAFPKIIGVDKFTMTSQAAGPSGDSRVTADLTFTAYILKES